MADCRGRARRSPAARVQGLAAGVHTIHSGVIDRSDRTGGEGLFDRNIHLYSRVPTLSLTQRFFTVEWQRCRPRRGVFRCGHPLQGP